MRIFNTQQFKALLPIRTLFIERFAAETDFHPLGHTIRVDARLMQIMKILIARHRSFAERSIFDRLEEFFFASFSHPRFNEITHT